MSPDTFERLLSAIAELNPKAWVHLSTWGEIGLHPHASGLVERVLAEPGLRLLVETSGVGWKREEADALFAQDSDRFSLVIGLDTNDADRYQVVRGTGYEEAQRFARTAVDALGNRAHVQAVRSDDTEETLDRFYREWKEKTDNIVIQKYDHFCGRLPQKKIGDISPIQRFPCWHLQRDMTVLVDGTVPLCREDLDASFALGNAFEESLEKCWNAGQSRYAQHVHGAYNELCGSCDEFYTFSF
jgi:spiro-SPASM protein